jgi:hypothetical protein
VKTVDNRIEVPASEKIAHPTDEAIHASIHAALVLEPDIATTDLVLAVARPPEPADTRQRPSRIRVQNDGESARDDDQPLFR